MLQPDSRKVPASIVAPQLTSWQFLTPPNLEEVDPDASAIVSALDLAFLEDPDHVFCVSDYGLPAAGEEVNWYSYFCNRWAGSLNSDKESFFWGAVPIGVNPKETLADFRSKYGNDQVVIIRIPNPVGAGATPLQISETWWGEYVHESWQIVSTSR
jgi:hypothetical protein